MDTRIKIKYIASLGTLCHTATFLKAENLKTCSYPFDWVFSNPLIVADCINDNFKKLLDKENYIDTITKVDIKEGQCGHKLYGAKMFWHRDMRRDENYEYLVRCVNRFNELLINKSDPKLFIITYVNGECLNYRDIKNDVYILYDTLMKRTDNFYLLVMENFIGSENKKDIQIDNHIIFVKYWTISTSNGIYYTKKEDEDYYRTIIFDLFERPI